jgi:plastocyanin
MISLAGKFRIFLTAASRFVLPLTAHAQTTHDVTVGDSFFSPADLTIEMGDTVRWTNAPGGLNHDVTADDFTFASTTSNEFIFQRTFNSVEEVLYHCSVHSAAGGSAMNGRVNVIEGEGNDFLLNAGLNDSWFNPATPGQGFFITVFPDDSSIFLAWFTYDTVRPDPSVTANLGEPGHRWLTAFGDYAGGSALLDVELTEGGVFNAAQPPVMQSLDGTILLECSGCNECMVTYDITSAGVQGVVPIERIALDNVFACEGLSGVSI